MLLALILILNFSCPLSEENAVGVRFQSHTEYKVIAWIGNTEKAAKSERYYWYCMSGHSTIGDRQ